MAEIHRRTFEALKHPKGSAKRAELNESAVTSEYMPSYRYALVDGGSQRTFKTKVAAEAAADRR